MTTFILTAKLMATILAWSPSGYGVLKGTDITYEYLGSGEIRFSPNEFNSYVECKTVERAVLQQFVGAVKSSGCFKKEKND